MNDSEIFLLIARKIPSSWINTQSVFLGPKGGITNELSPGSHNDSPARRSEIQNEFRVQNDKLVQIFLTRCNKYR